MLYIFRQTKNYIKTINTNSVVPKYNKNKYKIF